MTIRWLLMRGLLYDWRAHLGVGAGAALTTAVLVGALLVGDSVRGSLDRMARERLGAVTLALIGGDRMTRAALAEELSAQLQTPVAPVLLTRGIAATLDQQARAGNVNVLGVDARFWALGSGAPPAVDTDGVRLNARLARRLNIGPGDTVLLRIDKPSALSRDAPLATTDDSTLVLRLRVAGLVDADSLGNFGLQASQVEPYNAFLPLEALQRHLEAPGRANLLLAAGELAPERAEQALHAVWRLADIQASLQTSAAAGGLELRSERVFLDHALSAAALRAASPALPVLTYFVNELRCGERAVPYSMVAALPPGRGLLPAEMNDDEIAINTWLADNLATAVGDTIELAYYVAGRLRSLEERRAAFRVRAVLPMEGAAIDAGWMPDFPGLADAEHCRDWRPGFAIDLGRIRKEDEAYWERYRGAPKAFITLAVGQALWANRFGDLTAVRYPAAATETVEAALLAQLDPAALGLRWTAVAAEAQAASRQALDFGQLFLGLSFFLIVAALLLVVLLFALGLQQRAPRLGALLALGFLPRRVSALVLGEATIVAALGCLVGLAGGVVYTRLVLAGLAGVWNDAVGATTLRYHAQPATMLVGGVIAFACALVAVIATARGLLRRPAVQLLAGQIDEDALAPKTAQRVRARSAWLALGATGAAATLLALALLNGWTQSPAVFFCAGCLLLIGELAGCRFWLTPPPVSSQPPLTTLGRLGARGAARRPVRSLGVTAALACGVFLLVAVAANQRDPAAGSDRRDSGTGGYALVGETAIPIVHDLNTADGRDAYGLSPRLMRGVDVAALRVIDGDDASCLNLNRAQRPRLLAVDTAAWSERNAFAFAAVMTKTAGSPWNLLTADLGPDEMPAIGDQATVRWALGLGLGSAVPYIDERGRTFRLRIVGMLAHSMLQGSLIIDEQRALERFPGLSGYRMLLIDVPPERLAELQPALTRALESVGLELMPTRERLALYARVERTYLAVFQALGGLGLLLGSVGLAIVVGRNVLERRAELALLRAVGFERRAVARLLLLEHRLLLAAGLGVGAIAGLAAASPALLAPGGHFPAGSLALTVGAVALSGALWVQLAVWSALRGALLSALRDE